MSFSAPRQIAFSSESCSVHHSQLFGWPQHIQANSTRQLLASSACCLEAQKQQQKIMVISDQSWQNPSCSYTQQQGDASAGSGHAAWEVVQEHCYRKVSSVSICESILGSPSMVVAAMAKDCQCGPAQTPKTSCSPPSSFSCSQASVETPPRWWARPPRSTVLY